MHPLIPLLFSLIGFNGRQFREDKQYRLNVFSLVGISYFCFLTHISYWHETFSAPAWVVNFISVLVVMTTVAIALSPWLRHGGLAKTASLGLLFSAVLVGSYVYDREVKETIARMAGFYGDEILSFQSEPEPHTVLQIALPSGLELEVPTNWELRDMPSGHVYFNFYASGQKALELRPNCVGRLRLDTPTIIKNALARLEAEGKGLAHKVECQMTGSGVKECLIQVRYEKTEGMPRERWYWLSIPRDRRVSTVVDVLLFDDSPALRSEALVAIASVRRVEQDAAVLCTTPAAWL